MRKVKDHYFHKAKREGFAARSVYKLEEIDRKHRLIRGGMRVLELGCAPGSWLQYTLSKVGPSGRVTGVDLQPMTAGLKGEQATHVRIIQGDVFDIDIQELQEEGQPFDLVLSDMAPGTTGIKSADAIRSAALSEQALNLALAVLRPGGSLLVKVFESGALPALRKAFQTHFNSVTLEKPSATRSESVEVFLLGKNRKQLPG